jgi:hypothetical protein
MPKGQFTPLTASDEAQIRKEYLTKPIKRIAKELGTTNGVIMRRLKKWGLSIPVEVKQQSIRQSQFAVGSTPSNKGKSLSDYLSPEIIEKMKRTQFKKGAIPKNSKHDGYERSTRDGYIEIRVSPGCFRLKHNVEWEMDHGNVPKGYCLKCISGDKTNTHPSNWRKISRAENMLMNSRGRFPKEIIPSMALVSQINKRLKNIQHGSK